jgi:hypothetical protein
VPLISAQTINDVIKPLLSALQTVENVYVKGYREKAKDKITKLELQDFISQSVGTSSKYEDQIGTLQQQYKGTVATFNDLAVKRSAAATNLQKAGENFQKEIVSKLRLDALLTGLQAIATIATASVPNLIQIGDTLSELRRNIACLLSQHLHRSTCSQCNHLKTDAAWCSSSAWAPRGSMESCC